MVGDLRRTRLASFIQEPGFILVQPDHVDLTEQKENEYKWKLKSDYIDEVRYHLSIDG